MWPVSWNADLALKIAEMLVGDNAEPPAEAMESAASRRDSVATDYNGSYWAEPGLPLEITGIENGLEFLSPDKGSINLHSPARLQKTDEPDTFVVSNGRAAGEIVSFERDEEGAISGFSLGGFKYRKLG